MRHGSQHGYTYLTLLFAVAFMGAGLAAASSLWHTAQMREKERELLYVGDQYKKAIQAYYEQGKTYPRELAQLLRDQRVQGVRRYLRKLYRDPITGKAEWGIVKMPDGGIAGVYSLSEQTPFKQAEFPKDYAEFTGKAKYSDWKFAYLQKGAPGTTTTQGAPGAASQPGTAGTPGGPGSPGGLLSAPGTQSPGSPAAAPTQSAPASPGGASFGAPGGGSSQGSQPQGSKSQGSQSQASPSSIFGSPQPASPGR